MIFQSSVEHCQNMWICFPIWASHDDQVNRLGQISNIFMNCRGSFTSFDSWETWNTWNGLLFKIVNFQRFSDALRHLHIRRWRFKVEHPLQQIKDYVFKKWNPRWGGGSSAISYQRRGWFLKRINSIIDDLKYHVQSPCYQPSNAWYHMLRTKAI